jgi:hypothetical protein
MNEQKPQPIKLLWGSFFRQLLGEARNWHIPFGQTKNEDTDRGKKNTLAH